MMSDPVAKEARRRIARLSLGGGRGFVVRAAGNSQWPFDIHWDAEAHDSPSWGRSISQPGEAHEEGAILRAF